MWKNEKEKDMQCFYLKPSGVKTRTNHKKEYFICHRSYLPHKYRHSTAMPSKKLKGPEGSSKLAHSCPSTIELVERDGHYKATIFLPHFGHQCSLKHINLSTVERAQIAGMFKSTRELMQQYKLILIIMVF